MNGGGLLDDGVLHHDVETAGFAFFIFSPYARFLRRILMIPCKIGSSEESPISGNDAAIATAADSAASMIQ